jgi:cell division initiation protein
LSISPLDVRNQIFKKKLRGYDADEVKIFLDAVADRMEDMIKEKEDLEKENSALRERSNTFAELETTLRETMVTAQRICDEAKVNAQKEADIILHQADLDAQARAAEASKKVEDIVRAHDDTRAQTLAFVAKMRSLLEGQLSFLGTTEHEVRSETEIRLDNVVGHQEQGHREGQSRPEDGAGPENEARAENETRPEDGARPENGVTPENDVKDQGVEVQEGVGS